MALAGALGAAVISGGTFITTDPDVLAMPAAPWGILMVSAAYGPWFTIDDPREHGAVPRRTPPGPSLARSPCLVAAS